MELSQKKVEQLHVGLMIRIMLHAMMRTLPLAVLTHLTMAVFCALAFAFRLGLALTSTALTLTRTVTPAGLTLLAVRAAGLLALGIAGGHSQDGQQQKHLNHSNWFHLHSFKS